MTEFNGFSKELVQFFKNLNKNNTKSWFDKHRNEYDENVLFPSREFVATMGKRLRKIAPGVNAIPKVNQSNFILKPSSITHFPFLKFKRSF